MPTLTMPFTRRTDSSERYDDDRHEIGWGIAGVLFVAVLLVICGAVYVLPFSKTTYTALLSEAGAVQVGDDVRVAGIPVGSVRSVDLLPDQVRLRFEVDNAVFVGAETSLDIRMLTAVGGHYVAMLPAGSKPLGKQPIPPDRVRLPYSLMQVFQDAATPLGTVDGDVLRRNFAALGQSLADNPDAIRRLGAAATTIVSLLDQQRRDVSAALTAADEYIGAIDAAKSTVARLIDRIGAVETILIDKRDEINAAIPLTIQFLSRIAALEPAYRTSLQPLVDEFAKALPELQRLGARFDDIITSVDALSARVAQHATDDGIVLDQSGTALSPFCVPLPGKAC